MASSSSSKRKIIAAIGFMLFFGVAAALATTAVVIVTPTAIVAVTDTKTVNYPGNLNAPAVSGSATKIFVVRNRFAVADVGLERLTHATPTGETVLFDFPSWLSAVEQRLPQDVSVTGLTRVVKDESDRVFMNLGVDNFYDPRAEKDEATNVQRLAQFLVIGHENGIPSVNLVEYKIDWNRRQLSLSTEVVHPVQGKRVDFGVYLFGKVPSDSSKPQSQAQRRLAELVPDEDRAVRSHQDLTPDQAVRFAAAFVLVESENEPTQVGFPITAVTIPREGTGSAVTYSKEALRFAEHR